ncbi:MAG: hypothetical protein ACOYB3_00160 [Azonexus sp.]
MHDIGQFVGVALATSKTGDHEWLTDLAVYAFHNGKQLEVEDRHNHIIVRNLTDHRWLAIPLDSEDDAIKNLIDNFDSQYAAMLPEIENPGRDGEEDGHMYDESLSHRIVDVLLDSYDPDEFIQDYNRVETRPGGTPINSEPSGKRIIRAIQLETGHKLYVWRTSKQREHWGTGPGSFYMGYRLVAPSGQILVEDDGFHPGGRHRGRLSNSGLAMLVQSLCSDSDGFDDEEIELMDTTRREWLKNPAREELEFAMSMASDEGGDFPDDASYPWRDLPGYEYTPQEA